EALDPLRDVAHQLGNLATPEQKHEQHEHDQNMRPTQSHLCPPARGPLARLKFRGTIAAKAPPSQAALQPIVKGPVSRFPPRTPAPRRHRWRNTDLCPFRRHVSLSQAGDFEALISAMR